MLKKILSLFMLPIILYADPFQSEPADSSTSHPETFHSFTGKITNNRVRIRTQPNLSHGIIWKELNKGDLLIVTAETEDFYAILPPPGTKAYIFRTYVLDNHIEGDRVNVRLTPDVDAPIIAQLNHGDIVEGQVSRENSRWIEVIPPQSTRFFVAKDYVENIGEASLFAQLEEERQTLDQTMERLKEHGKSELEKPFREINIEPILINLTQIVKSYPNYPEQLTQAEELKKEYQEQYNQKKLAYYEQLAKRSTKHWQSQNQELQNEIHTQKNKIKSLQDQMQSNDSPLNTGAHITPKMAAWHPTEKQLWRQWIKEENRGGKNSMEEFYASEQENSTPLVGIIENYDKQIKNKPGDYRILDTKTGMAIAFLYSTKVDLQEYVGKEVRLIGSQRPNNHFAFPAYFVLSIEE